MLLLKRDKKNLMQKGMNFAAQKGYETVHGVCKKELLSRWQKNGFEPIPNAPLTEQNGMTLVPIYCTLPKVDKTITLQTEASVLNAKEGEWFEMPQTDATMRIKNLIDKVKMIKSAAFELINIAASRPTCTYVKFVSSKLSRLAINPTKIMLIKALPNNIT